MFRSTSWIIRKRIDELLDFDVQTTLESFNKPGKTKAPKNVPDLEKEKIQCLIGLWKVNKPL